MSFGVQTLTQRTEDMTRRRPDLPAQTPPKPQLQDALSRIAGELTDQPLRSSTLARIMREAFGGSDACGAWSWRMAYDMMQAAAVMEIMRASGSDAIASARSIAARLLTETRRSEQQIRLQQFSTPLPVCLMMCEKSLNVHFPLQTRLASSTTLWNMLGNHTQNTSADSLVLVPRP